MITEKDIALLIVFFKPSKRQKDKALHLANSYPLVIIDNTPGYHETNKFPSNVVYVSLNDNRGIATAQNFGLEIIAGKGYKAVLFLDQDSDINTQIIKGLVTAFNEISDFDTKVVAVGPLVVDSETGSKYKTTIISKKQYDKVSTIISSGTLARLDYLKDVGGMDESLFIDNVDHEWCWRAKEKGYSVYRANNILFPHKVGTHTYSFFGIQLMQSSSIRYYYKYRNLIILIKKSHVPFKWKIINLVKLPVVLLAIPFIQPEPFPAYSFLFRGIWHGICNKYAIV